MGKLWLEDSLDVKGMNDEPYRVNGKFDEKRTLHKCPPPLIKNIP
jgi:hypothetical protein